jgi:nitrite reductase/ring-hydroxylating ferredoxin subunit
MFKNILLNSHLIKINALFIGTTYLQQKINKTLYLNSQQQSENSIKMTNPRFETLNNSNPNMDPNNKKREIDAQVKRLINEYRSAVLFEEYTDLFSFDSEEESQKKSKLRRKEEEYISLGDDKILQNRAFIQFDVNKYRNPEELDQDILNYPEKFFQKILVFRIKDNLYATSSFCGYDLTDLKNAVLLGNKLICPTCLSEYNIENGVAESGPNTKFLATFPVASRKNQIILKIPYSKVPIFSRGQVTKSEELDPRHYVLIGDNETVWGCVENLVRTFTGKISIINHQSGNDFLDTDKLSKSFFPLKMRHAKLIPDGWLEFFKINLYKEKVLKIDGFSRMITLSSGNKIPFDKVLIAVGSTKRTLDQLNRNTFQLNTIRDHANIHNAIIKPETKSVAIIGDSFRAIEMASAMRRYLDAIDKEDAKIYIITSKDTSYFEKLGMKNQALKIISDYLKRNRIFLFSGVKEINYESNPDDTSRTVRVNLITEKYVFKLPADVYIHDSHFLVSNCDFIKQIHVNKTLQEDSFGTLMGNLIVPDERMSLHTSDRYAHIFTAGSCSALKSLILPGLIRTSNMKANFHMGYTASLNLQEVYYRFDDIVCSHAKVLDKNLVFLGNDNLLQGWEKNLVYYDPQGEKFIIYYFIKNKLSGVLLYGYNRSHIFLREAMRMNITPEYDYFYKHLESAHLKITEEVLKYQDRIECFKHKAWKESFNVDTTKFSIEDQQYSDGIIKRGIAAYKKIDEDIKNERREANVKSQSERLVAEQERKKLYEEQKKKMQEEK